jgi:hypothetical protein
MVFIEVGLMAITNYDYNKRPRPRQVTSQQFDTGHRYFRPLHKYGIRDAHLNREVQRYDYSAAGSISPRGYGTYEIEFEEAGLDKLTTDLYKIEEEERLRKYNPSLQAAWDHYQTVLGLVK